MNKFKYCLMAAALMAATVTGFSSCSDDDDEESTVNPALEEVIAKKKHDTAILLCSFGSTYHEATHVYDEVRKDFETAFPDADVFLSFSSNTCIARLEATRDESYYHIDQWLNAIADAGYSKVAVQSLHVIPGEEYLAVMNSTVKKDFMIRDYYKHPNIKVLKSANLLDNEEDTEEVAKVLYQHYSSTTNTGEKDMDVLNDKHNLVLLMGHGNPNDSYNANKKYSDIEAAMQDLTKHKNVLVGTVDYGKMLFWPYEEKDGKAEVAPEANAESVYSKLVTYCETNNLKPEEVTIYLAPFMSISGDHAHNDLWGIEALAEGDKDLAEARPNNIEASWRERILNMGFKVGDKEVHPSGQYDADHGIESGCGVRALGDYAAIRQIWVNHLKEKYNNKYEWEDGADYQPE